MTQQKLATLCETVLKEEGYNPEIQGETVMFKKEGGNYAILFEESDDLYLRFVFPNFWSFKSAEERLRVFEAANLTMQDTKALKITLTDDNTWAWVELYLPNPPSADAIKVLLNRSLASFRDGVEKMSKRLRTDDIAPKHDPAAGAPQPPLASASA